MTKPWKQFELATGRLAEMNRIVQRLAHQVVEAGFWPNLVTIGEKWLEGRPHPKSFWLGEFGINARVEVVPGTELTVTEEAGVRNVSIGVR